MRWATWNLSKERLEPLLLAEGSKVFFTLRQHVEDMEVVSDPFAVQHEAPRQLQGAFPDGLRDAALQAPDGEVCLERDFHTLWFLVSKNGGRSEAGFHQPLGGGLGFCLVALPLHLRPPLMSVGFRKRLPLAGGVQ